MREPATLGHVALHLSKYAGELAAIAEHLEHPDDPVKAEKARRLAAAWRQGRGRAVGWCVGQAERLLEAVR